MRTSVRRAGVGALLALWCLPGVAVAETPTPAPTPARPTPAGAATPSSTPSTRTTYQTKPTDFALTISPTRLLIGRGTGPTTQQIQVINRGSASVRVTVQKRNFLARPDGSLDYQREAPYAAADWVTVSPMVFDAEPGATQTVTATVAVPAEPEPGDHQTALIFLVPPTAAEGNIKISRGIGMPVYVTVPGPVDESVRLTRLDAPSFVAGGPVTVTAGLQNTGTVHRDFRGPTALRVAGAGAAEPFPDFTVARGASREVKTTWNPPLLCVCHLSVDIANVDGPQIQRVRVVVFPWHLALIVVGAAGLVLLGARLFRRQYRASVLAAAARMNAPPKDGGG